MVKVKLVISGVAANSMHSQVKTVSLNHIFFKVHERSLSGVVNKSGVSEVVT